MLQTKWLAVALFFIFGGFIANAEPSLRLLLFSTPWCSDCVREVPELHRQLKSKLGSSYSALEVTLFAETGKKPNDKPTAESAAEMAKQFGVDFPAQADPWRWQTFRKYFPDVALGIPASVVLDGEGNVLKACKPEVCSPDEISDFIAGKIEPVPSPYSIYLFGEARNLRADGSANGASVYLIERKVIPAEGRIEITSTEVTDTGKLIPRTTLMYVDGDQYRVTDPQGSYEGMGKWQGKPWRWEKWSYSVDFPKGAGSLRGEDELTDTQLKMRKHYFDGNRKLLHTISADFSRITPAAYEILKRKLNP